MLEREGQLAALHQSLAAADTDHGSFVLVTGEAGAGKTTVLSRFRSTLATDVDVAVGLCDPLTAPRALGPLLDIVEDLGLVVGQSHDVAREILHRAALRTTVIIIEDAHWADDATLDAVVFLVRRMAELRLLLVVSYREDEVGADHPLRVALGRVATSRPQRITIPPLTRDAVRLLSLGSSIDPDELVHVTGGNPFFVTEVLAGGEERVPRTIVDSVLARASSLSTAGRGVLETASVMPRGATDSLLNRLTSSPRGIDEARGAGLLEDVRGRLRFRHEIARLALETSLDPRRRQLLHTTVLRSFPDIETAQPYGLDVTDLAHHAVHAGQSDLILRYCRAAAQEAAAAGAHRAAADHWAHALAAGGELSPQERAQALEGQGAALGVVGRAVEACASYTAAARAWSEQDEPGRQGEALAHVAAHLWLAGHGPQAREQIAAAVEMLEPVGGRPLAAALAQQSRLRMLARDVDGAVSAGERAIELAEPIGANAVLSRAYNSIGAALWFADPDRAEAPLLQALELARAAGDDNLVASAMVNLGSGAGEIRRYDVAEPWLEAAVSWCEDRDLDGNRDYAQAWRARVLLERGQWTAAAAHAHVVASRSEVVIARIVSLTTLGLLRSRRGDPDGTVLAEAWDLALETADLQRLWPVAAARAEAAWWRHGALSDTGELRTVFEMAASLRHVWAVGDLGTWLQRAGEDVPAGLLVAEPYAATLSGDPLSAAACWDQLGCPFDAAAALLDAREEPALLEAVHRFDRLGASAASRFARTRLRDLGVTRIPRGPRSSTREDPSGLTAREQEVMAGLARGLTNTAIAAELVISPRTVDRHVSNVLRKLNASTRTEAVAALQSLQPE